MAFNKEVIIQAFSEGIKKKKTEKSDSSTPHQGTQRKLTGLLSTRPKSSLEEDPSKPELWGAAATPFLMEQSSVTQVLKYVAVAAMLINFLIN